VTLILKRASASRSSGEWNAADFDVLADRVVVGRILKVHAAPVGSPWMWTLTFGHHEDRTPTHGYAATCETAMPAFAESWRRERMRRNLCHADVLPWRSPQRTDQASMRVPGTPPWLEPGGVLVSGFCGTSIIF
jgi:hypothetical protein